MSCNNAQHNIHTNGRTQGFPAEYYPKHHTLHLAMHVMYKKTWFIRPGCLLPLLCGWDLMLVCPLLVLVVVNRVQHGHPDRSAAFRISINFWATVACLMDWTTQTSLCSPDASMSLTCSWPCHLFTICTLCIISGLSNLSRNGWSWFCKISGIFFVVFSLFIILNCSKIAAQQ